MKRLSMNLILLICLFSSIGLSATYTNDAYVSRSQAKLYFDATDLEFSDNAIYIHSEDYLVEATVIRTDKRGFYFLESEIASFGPKREKEWKCPYCHHWWPIGQKCQNPECPTNQW